jgi:hypothetical protein
MRINFASYTPRSLCYLTLELSSGERRYLTPDAKKRYEMSSVEFPLEGFFLPDGRSSSDLP